MRAGLWLGRATVALAQHFSAEGPPIVKPITVHLIAAARPNFMKIAPLYHALARGGQRHAL